MAELEMLASFHSAAVAALVDAEAAPASPGLIADVQEFVRQQMGRLPLHMRAGVNAIALLLVLRSAVHGPFWHQEASHRLRALRRWESSRITVVAQYVRLIRSLTLLRAYEAHEVMG